MNQTVETATPSLDSPDIPQPPIAEYEVNPTIQSILDGEQGTTILGEEDAEDLVDEASSYWDFSSMAPLNETSVVSI